MTRRPHPASAPKSYAAIRAQLLSTSNRLPPTDDRTVREPSSPSIAVLVSERLAQCIWYDQRLKRDSLKLTDGTPLRVIDPGWWNLEAGPDFRHATIQIGDAPPLTGDVEIHLTAADWRAHGHSGDRNYTNVILHAVMWDDARQPARTADGRAPAQFAMFPHLDSPLEELCDALDTDAYSYAAHNHAGRCEATLKRMSAESVSELLAQAGDERFAAKARRFARWSRRGGFEQAFHEGFMEALGYKGNKSPFRALARSFTLEDAAAHRDHASRDNTRLRFEAMLLGLSGLLPDHATASWPDAARQRAKHLWEYWWKHRSSLDDRLLQRRNWNFASLRPANHPQRRIAAAAVFLTAHPQPLQEAADILARADEPRLSLAALQHWFEGGNGDPFWLTHFTLGGKAQSKPAALLGPQRIHELLLNALLPALLARADADGDAQLRDRTRAAHAAMPRLPAHSVERFMYTRLLAGRTEKASVLLPTARHQQGLLQIFHDFCLDNTTNCQTCLYPELLDRWSS